ncbi:MAG TPA: aldo/keto reductase [Candidatus Limnocylindria bacterium]
MIPRAPFGRTGHQSRRTLFGAAALSRVTQAEADRSLELLVEHDIDHIDTAASYGDAELRIAPWLARLGRDRFFVATKTGKRTYVEARDEIRRSLERLGTGHVDLIQLHNLVAEDEWETAFAKDGALRAAVEARDAGLVRFIGVTGHGVNAPRQHRRSLERFPFDSVLFPYNVTQLRGQYATDAEALIALCEARGVAMQTIKAITLGAWHGERPARPTTWYEPLTAQADIDLAVRFVLSRPGLFLNTVGDLGLLPKVLDAAARGGPRPTDEEMAALVERRAMTPFFV